MLRLTPPAPDRPLLVVGPSLGTAVAPLWGRCARLLADRFEIVGWELPGHGQGAATTVPFSVAELAEQVVAGAEGLRAGSFAYAGDSIGGAVGLALLLGHAERVTEATIACTGAHIGTAQGWSERAELVREQGTEAVVEGSIGRWFAPGFTDREPEVTAEFIEILRAIDAESYALTCGALATFDVRAELSRIDRPLTVIAGAEDVPTPVANAQEIVAGVPGARLHVLDAVGHLAPIEAPERVAALVGAA